MSQVARVTMKEFVANIEDDEEMLQFAADHMDADEEDLVEIVVTGRKTTFALIKQTTHTLTIHWSPSGTRQPQKAECSCGKWKRNFALGGGLLQKVTEREIEEIWRQHL